MDIIKAGIDLSRTIKNVGRLREIVSVFAKYGFAELIQKTNIHTKIPDIVLPKSVILESPYGKDDWWGSIGHRLRKSFEELGPSFVKLGQLLSTRDDLFGPSFIEEMRLLRDKVSPMPFEEVKSVFEKSLNQKVEDIFIEIQDQPIGTASIGLVYKATLKNQEKVVVKIRRPNIIKTIETDFDILSFICIQLEKVSKEIKHFAPSRLIQDFAVTLKTEVDFRTEALNCTRFKDTISNSDPDSIFYIPKVYQHYTTEEVLILEFLDGIPFSNTEKIAPFKELLQGKLETGLRVFVKTMLVDGFFHADLHGGNFFLLNDQRIGIIDFGLVGNLGKKNRINLIAILYALITHNYDQLVYEFLEVAEYDALPDMDILVRDVRAGLSPYVGLTVQQMDLGLLLKTIIKILSKHGLYLPRDWFVVFRALMTLDGVGRSLKLDFDIFSILEKDIRGMIRSFLTKEGLLEEGIWTAKDIFSTIKILPRYMRWFLRDFSKRKFSIEINQKGYNQEFKQLSTSIYFLSYIILSVMLFVSGTLIFNHFATQKDMFFKEIPTLSLIFWGLSLASFFYAQLMLRKKK